ncbi:MAG: dihydrodipicolinate reductase [Pseudomonadota bacterium]|uniref:4-hydroxy-tetrahydrodipicolinate reductase n=1 Tax=Candidatus Desulfatibia profunda TaxID=2841695 RepID=A0A8J6TN25_9BACT|nr:dihydrodipicolinate reductase [Candidatus Desulfatibia profunda]MBL7180505.1 dihydrodipicolinate reductase [Desulfobacterales bacterium]
MNRIKVMVNGLPGNMASNVAKRALKDDRFELIPQSLTGPEITETETTIDSTVFTLIQPQDRNQAITAIKENSSPFISVDYALPAAVNDNAEFYCTHNLPFVMGTTGGDRTLLTNTVTASSICAVIAPNMAKQIVGFQAMMEYAARTFPNLFEGYTLEIKESHQKGKADTSGTAKAMVGYFNSLGIPFAANDIIMERNPKVQQDAWGIPAEFLSGHGWHTYTLISKDKTVRFEFTHNVNGRDVYALGTLDAILFLDKKVQAGVKGKVFTMIDVLKGV